MSVGNDVSTIMMSWYGTIQSSILGPVLYDLFLSPLFKIEKLTSYADNKFLLVWVNMMERKLAKINDWLSKSGLKVNEAKTALCLFQKRDTTLIASNINGNFVI